MSGSGTYTGKRLAPLGASAAVYLDYEGCFYGIPDANVTEGEAKIGVKHLDDLRQVIGIGVVFQRRLHDAGIYTFAELAALRADRIREIVQSVSVDAEDWIKQAIQLSPR